MIEINILARYVRLVRRARSASAFASKTALRAHSDSAPTEFQGDAPTVANEGRAAANRGSEARWRQQRGISHEFRRSARIPAAGSDHRRGREARSQPGRVRRVAQARTARYLRRLAATRPR